MHDLDRIYMETAGTQDSGSELEDSGELFESSNESPFNEVEEMELASELLEVTSDAELDQFLGNIFKKFGGAIGKAARPLGGILKTVAKHGLPIAGGALGTVFGGPLGGMLGSSLGSAATKAFGLELEGLSPEDREFEAAKRFVRFAGTAAKKASNMEPSSDPNSVAKKAVVYAAKKHLPGLLSKSLTGCTCGAGGSVTGAKSRTGRWFRRGRKIILMDI